METTEEIGTAPAEVDAPAPAPATDTTTESVQAADHTPDLDRLVEDVQKNWDKIPAEKRALLDRNFQPAFSKRVNWLNNNIETALKTAGVELPEGKTALDLVTENDGRGLADYLKSVVGQEIAPVKNAIETAQFNQNLQAARDMVAADNPELVPHFEQAVSIIESNPDLLGFVKSTGGKGLYRALQGVGSALEVQRLKNVLKEREDLLAKNKIAVKTSGGTTRAGSQAPKATAPAKPKTIAEAARFALDKMKAESADI